MHPRACTGLNQGNRKVRKTEPSRPPTISGNRLLAVEGCDFAGAQFLPFARLGDFAIALGLNLLDCKP